MTGRHHLRLAALLLGILLLLLLSWTAFGANYHVALDGSEDFISIQEAIDFASDNDSVIVHPGTYVENIAFGGKNITVRSTDPRAADVVWRTIIDGSRAGSVVTFHGNEDPSCRFEGFFVRNGYAHYGGGIYGGAPPGCPGSEAQIRSCMIVANEARSYGGGIYNVDGLVANCMIRSNSAPKGGGMKACDGRVEKCEIRDNSADYGGGIYSCKGMIRGCLVAGNRAEYDGGGLCKCSMEIDIGDKSAGEYIVNARREFFLSADVIDCQISNNTAGRTGGGFSECHGIIRGCIIQGNLAGTDGDSFWDRGGGAFSSCEATITDCLVLSNCSEGDGGAFLNCDADVVNCLIVDNWAGNIGGGLYGCGGCLTNCTVAGNRVEKHGGALAYCTTSVVNCILWGNSTPETSEILSSVMPSYSCVQNVGAGGIGNTSQDPLFRDPESLDYRLGEASPCIDAGDSAAASETDFDLAGSLRLVAGSVDMGAYEFNAACFVTIAPDRSFYLSGETISLSLGCGNLDVSRTVDLYAALLSPDQTLVFIPSLSDTPEPWFAGVSLPQGFVLPPTELFQCPLPETSPDGRYVLYAALFQHGQFDIAQSLSGIASASFVFASSRPTEYVVRKDGMGDFFAIQDAIDTADNGDEIAVHPGAYFETIRLHGKSVALRSVEHDDEELASETVIDARYRGSVITLDGVEDDRCIISGFTVIHGLGSAPGIRGTVGEVHNRARILNCVFRDNTSQWADGGYNGVIFCCDGLIADCEVTQNSATGIDRCDATISTCYVGGNLTGIDRCNGSILNCIITGNSAPGIHQSHGTVSSCVISHNNGGLEWCHGTIQNCLILANAGEWGECAIFGCDGLITNCTVVDNWHYGRTSVRHCDGAIRSCVFWGNTSSYNDEFYECSVPEYCCIENYRGDGKGNISDDPFFTTGPLGDYYLSQVRAGQEITSLCVNAGHSTAQAAGLDSLTTRTDGMPDDGAVDIGYHYPLPDLGCDQKEVALTVLGD